MAARTANSVARRAWGWPPSVRHVRIVGPAAGVAAAVSVAASSGARHGAAGEPPRHLPRGHPELPGVRLGAHDLGGRGGHGERWASRPPRGRRRGEPSRCGTGSVGASPRPRHLLSRLPERCPPFPRLSIWCFHRLPPPLCLSVSSDCRDALQRGAKSPRGIRLLFFRREQCGLGLFPQLRVPAFVPAPL